jgi:hypothetical protein
MHILFHSRFALHLPGSPFLEYKGFGTVAHPLGAKAAAAIVLAALFALRVAQAHRMTEEQLQEK